MQAPASCKGSDFRSEVIQRFCFGHIIRIIFRVLVVGARGLVAGVVVVVKSVKSPVGVSSFPAWLEEEEQ